MSSQIPPVVQIDPAPAFQPSASEVPPKLPRPIRKGRKISPVGTFTLPLHSPVTPLSSGHLQTPPVEWEIRQESRQDGNYFAPRPWGSQRSPTRVTRTTSPSDNRSNSSCLSPSAGSYHSSDIGLSTCSGSSSEYLTPPLFQSDKDNPPYKPRRGSSGSLTMIKKLRRANTLPDDKEALRKLKKRQRSQKKRHKCSRRKVKMHEHKSRSYWWLTGCQVVPTAPRGQKDMCEGVDGQHTKSKLRDTDTSGRLASASKSNTTPVIVGRRWSSVEVGAHQIISELTSALRPTVSTGLASPASEGLPAIQPFSPRFRSSTFTRGAMDNDIVRTVRERLTLRKLPSIQLKTPASITLRRASIVSSQSGTSHTPSTAFKSSEPPGGSTPLARLQGLLHQSRRRPSAAYLITSKDIDSIAALIEENIRRKYEARPRNKTTTNSSSAGSESPTVTSRGVLIPQSHPDVALTVAEAQTSSGRNQYDYLQVASGRKKQINIPRIPSQQSVHEVIWHGGGSPLSSTTEDEEMKRSPYCDCSPGSGTPRDMFQHNGCKTGQNGLSTNMGGAFDPQNANASINEWSMRCPQNEIAVVVTSSDSESNDNDRSPGSEPFEQYSQIQKKAASMQVTRLSKGRQKKRVQPIPRPAVSDSNLKQSRSRGLTLEDVISFPPLSSRKTTEEWYSPLPEMILTPPLNTSRSLYKLGLDANLGPLSSSSKTVTPQASFACLIQDAAKSPPLMPTLAGSIEFNPGFDLRKKSVVRVDSLNKPLSPDATDFGQGIDIHRKSIVKDHPSAIPRVGDLNRMGSALGNHGHERRRSSAVSGPKVKRVRTIDNAHKGERDTPSSKWRPPSVCPSRKPSSPMEAESFKDTRPPSPANTSRKGGPGFFDRAALIKDKSPPQPKVDTVGIYAQLTGSRRANTLRDPCLLEGGLCQPHDCDDCAKDPRNPSIDWIG
jgi:hypothetical protein